MTRDDIIRMAREAGYGDAMADLHGPALERFAALVAAHTLSNIDPSSFTSWQEGFEAGRLAEREACAKVCEDIFNDPQGNNGDDYYYTRPYLECAASIRARGQT